MIKRKTGRAADTGGMNVDFPAASGASRADLSPGLSTMDADAISDYLTDMIAQLEGLARATNRDMLAYLLSMAGVQASAPEARCDRSNALH